MRPDKTPLSDVRLIVEQVDWIQDLDQNPAAAFEPTLATHGIDVAERILDTFLMSANLTVTAGTPTLHAKLWGYDGTTWFEIEDLGTKSAANTVDGKSIRYIWRLMGMGTLERIATGVVGTPGGTSPTLVTQIGVKR